jgi:membrane peptidoglycan carboxypeptidase
VSAGSTFKVFTLMAALDEGIPVDTKINSPQTMDIDGYRSCPYTGVVDGRRVTNTPVGGGSWGPVSNAGDSEAGDFDLKTGTWKSVNTFYAQLEHRVGVCEAVRMAQDFGMVRADGNPLWPVPSQVLGTNEIDMVHLAAAYAGIAARGRYCAPVAITEVTDPSGHKLKLPPQDCHQAVDQSLADETTSILEGVLTDGTAKKVPPVGRPAAGKTGTCENFSCAVFAGYTPNLAAAVAYWDPRGEYKYPVTGVYGATIPGPIWARSMREALRGQPVMSFTDPSDTYGDVNTAGVPDVKGQSLGVAQAELAAAGFTTQVSPSAVPSDQPKGTVAYTSPSGNSTAQDGSQVIIFLSDGTSAPSP